jgi:putative flippase GtrA
MIKRGIQWGIDISEKYLLIRYIIAGGVSAVTDLGLLYLLYHYFGIHYLLAAVLAFIVSFLISFVLQKFWTFRSHEEKAHKQLIVYLFTSLLALGLNTLLMYIFVDHFHIHVIISQIVVGILVAFCTFSVSRKFVFKHKEKIF